MPNALLCVIWNFDDSFQHLSGNTTSYIKANSGHLSGSILSDNHWEMNGHLSETTFSDNQWEMEGKQKYFQTNGMIAEFDSSDDEAW